MTEIELRKHRSDAVRELERVLVLVTILPFSCLEWLDGRAAALERTIREYDEALSKYQRP